MALLTAHFEFKWLPLLMWMFVLRAPSRETPANRNMLMGSDILFSMANELKQEMGIQSRFESGKALGDAQNYALNIANFDSSVELPNLPAEVIEC